MTSSTVERCAEDGDDIVHIRSYRALRQTARDWSNFSNDVLGRIQIPAQDKTRTFRQYPIESDPPRHTAYRAVVQEMFNKPLDAAYIAAIEAEVDRLVVAALVLEELDIVQDFALPLQSRGLTYLLGMPIAEADLWVGWGMNVLGSEREFDLDQAAKLVDYLAQRLAEAPDRWSGSLFAYLRAVEFEGHPLPHDVQMGFAHLVFAGGRDTVIHLISGSIAYLAQNPAAFARLKTDPDLSVRMTEELVRFMSPLPYLGRICRDGATLDGVTVAPGQRVALCFAEANRDSAVFADADQVLIDRSPNPHVGFGSGAHNCPGSAHARLLSRTVMKVLAGRVQSISIAAGGVVPDDLSFDSLRVRLT